VWSVLLNSFQFSFLLFALVAFGGFLMTGCIAAKKRIPTLVHLGHGFLAMSGLGVLLMTNLCQPHTPPQAWWALGVFGFGFVCGITFFQVLFVGRPTVLLALMHGSLGAVGLYLLYSVAPF
jgi:hypothetical protein